MCWAAIIPEASNNNRSRTARDRQGELQLCWYGGLLTLRQGRRNRTMEENIRTTTTESRMHEGTRRKRLEKVKPSQSQISVPAIPSLFVPAHTHHPSISSHYVRRETVLRMFHRTSPPRALALYYHAAFLRALPVKGGLAGGGVPDGAKRVVSSRLELWSGVALFPLEISRPCAVQETKKPS